MGARSIPLPIFGFYGNRKNVGFYCHRIVTTTSGTIDTTNSDSVTDSGLASVVKTAAKNGRYTITTRDKHRKYKGCWAVPEGPADASYGAATKGLPTVVRNNAIATAGTIDLQFVQGDTNWNDGEVPDGTSFTIWLAVED